MQKTQQILNSNLLRTSSSLKRKRRSAIFKFKQSSAYGIMSGSLSRSLKTKSALSLLATNASDVLLKRVSKSDLTSSWRNSEMNKISFLILRRQTSSALKQKSEKSNPNLIRNLTRCAEKMTESLKLKNKSFKSS